MLIVVIVHALFSIAFSNLRSGEQLDSAKSPVFFGAFISAPTILCWLVWSALSTRNPKSLTRRRLPTARAKTSRQLFSTGMIFVSFPNGVDTAQFSPSARLALRAAARRRRAIHEN